MSKFYRELLVWKRIDDTKVVRFRCFEEMETHLFCVQNVDFYTMPLRADVIANSERVFLELLIEAEPMARCAWFRTVAEAINAHEDNFRSMAANIVAHEKEK
jgi:hypothetical protein